MSQERLPEEGTEKLCFEGGLRVNQAKMEQAEAEEVCSRWVELHSEGSAVGRSVLRSAEKPSVPETQRAGGRH